MKSTMGSSMPPCCQPAWSSTGNKSALNRLRGCSQRPESLHQLEQTNWIKSSTGQLNSTRRSQYLHGSGNLEFLPKIVNASSSSPWPITATKQIQGAAKKQTWMSSGSAPGKPAALRQRLVFSIRLTPRQRPQVSGKEQRLYSIEMFPRLLLGRGS